MMHKSFFVFFFSLHTYSIVIKVTLALEVKETERSGKSLRKLRGFSAYGAHPGVVLDLLWGGKYSKIYGVGGIQIAPRGGALVVATTKFSTCVYTMTMIPFLFFFSFYYSSARSLALYNIFLFFSLPFYLFLLSYSFYFFFFLFLLLFLRDPRRSRSPPPSLPPLFFAFLFPYIFFFFLFPFPRADSTKTTPQLLPEDRYTLGNNPAACRTKRIYVRTNELGSTAARAVV